MRILSVVFIALLIAGSPAAAQTVMPGFEKVHAKLKKKEADAIKDIANAEADAAAAEALRVEGERQVTGSAAAVEAQRSAYHTMGTTFGRATTANEAAAEASVLADIARNWSGSEAARVKAEKMVLKSQEDAAEAVTDKAKAESKLAEIRTSLERTIDHAAPDAPETLGAPQSSSAAPTIESSSLGPAQTGSLDDALLGAAPLKAD